MTGQHRRPSDRSATARRGTWPTSLLSGACAALVLSGLCSAAWADAKPTLAGVKFTKVEIALLKRLDQIQSGAGLASTMLKAAPFLALFSSPAPEDVAVTITGNDWDKIYGALTGLKKIQACATRDAIVTWHDVDGNDYSSDGTRTFFEDVRKKADDGCS